MWTCLENLQQSQGRSANGNWTIAETSASAMLHCERFQHAKKPCVVWNKQKLSNRTYICSEKHLSWYCTDTLLLHAQYFLFVVLHFICPLGKCSKTCIGKDPLCPLKRGLYGNWSAQQCYKSEWEQEWMETCNDISRLARAKLETECSVIWRWGITVTYQVPSSLCHQGPAWAGTEWWHKIKVTREGRIRTKAESTEQSVWKLLTHFCYTVLCLPLNTSPKHRELYFFTRAVIHKLPQMLLIPEILEYCWQTLGCTWLLVWTELGEYLGEPTVLIACSLIHVFSQMLSFGVHDSQSKMNWLALIWSWTRERQ